MAWHLTNWKWPISMWCFGILGVISEAKSVKVPLENVTNRWFNYHSFNISWPENEKMSAVVNLWRSGFLRCDRSKLPPKKGGCFIYYYFTIVIFFVSVLFLSVFFQHSLRPPQLFPPFCRLSGRRFDTMKSNWGDSISSPLLLWFDLTGFDSIWFASELNWCRLVATVRFISALSRY